MAQDVYGTPYQIHRTKEGDEMLIAQMEDKHLMALLSMQLRRIQSILLAPTDLVENLDPLSAEVVGKQWKQVQKESKASILPIIKSMSGYLFEAVLRGLITPDWVAFIQQMLGRSSAVPTLEMMQSLAALPPTISEQLKDVEIEVDYLNDPLS